MVLTATKESKVTRGFIERRLIPAFNNLRELRTSTFISTTIIITVEDDKYVCICEQHDDEELCIYYSEIHLRKVDHIILVPGTYVFYLEAK